VTDIANHPQQYQNPGNFSYNDLSCNHGTVLPGAHPHWQWDDEVSALFQEVRNTYGSAITVTSAYRCPRKNNSVSSAADSDHAYGRAFDWDQGSSAGNWAVAVAANGHATTVLLYCGSAKKSYQELIDLECGPSTFPAGWTGYTNGHAGND